MPFHRRCGERVTLLNNNLTAARNFIEFNHGVILSADPLTDDVVFEVRIDKMVDAWDGTVEIGVTAQDPETTELPPTATQMFNSAWLLTGKSIMKDGQAITHDYGTGLDNVTEGDNLGVMRSNKGELKFFINGLCLGVAASDLPQIVYAIINLYGQCVQVTIINPLLLPAPSMMLPEPTEQLPLSVDTETSAEQLPNNDTTETVSTEVETVACDDTPQSKEPDGEVRLDVAVDGSNDVIVAHDPLHFHLRCGIHISLSNDFRTAERTRPLEDYNHGVVMSHRPLRDDELLEVRLERLIEKWSGSIELGLTTHNPADLNFPNTMTNLCSGTIIMSGSKVLINGHATGNEYGHSNLDELRVGDRVGVMRSSGGKMYVYINGVNQGVACDKVRRPVWGVIDLYGMTVKVSIVNTTEVDIMQSGALADINVERTLAANRPRIDEDTLLFHTLRDSDVVVINDGKTAHRPNAHEFFHNGVVMTNRTLKTNELFQVRLDSVIAKWAGSIEIGVTQHLCNEILFPFKMSSAKSGTWAMTGEDVVRDGSVIIPQYVRDLSRLMEGDTVGVMRKDMGILHFYVNGVDQGVAAFNVPEHVFGVIDLYGKVAEVTIVEVYVPQAISSVDHSLVSQASSESDTAYPEMCFHRVHGRNVQLKQMRLTAKRRNVYSEFSDAMLFSSRPLRECEIFEIIVDRLVDCWMGGLEIGVTALRPDELEMTGEGNEPASLRGTAGDLRWNTHVLSGSNIMKNGELVLSAYPLDLDKLSVGSRVGLMWHSDRSLHYYLDGLDQGRAFDVPHLNIYAVVDIYGQCTQVSIVQNEERGANYACNSDNSTVANVDNADSLPPNCFSEYCGETIWLSQDDKLAIRRSVEPVGGLVFSSGYLRLGEPFQIQIERCGSPYYGSLRVGLTDIDILNAHVNRSLPSNITLLPNFTTYIDGDKLMRSTANEKEHITVGSVRPTFSYLGPNDTVALLKTDRNMVQVYLNSKLQEVSFTEIPDKVFVAAELYGSCTVVKVVDKSCPAKVVERPLCAGQPIYIRDVEAQQQKQLEEQNLTQALPVEITTTTDATPVVATTILTVTQELAPAVDCEDQVKTVDKSRPFTFHSVCGSNIRLMSSDTVAVRKCSYNNGIVVVSFPLQRGQTCNIRVDKLDGSWAGNMMVGAVAELPKYDLPESAIQLEGKCWVIDNDMINHNGNLIPSNMGRFLSSLEVSTILGLHFTTKNTLEMLIDGELCGMFAQMPQNITQLYPLVDVYGKCTQVSVLMHTYKVEHTYSMLKLYQSAENQTGVGANSANFMAEEIGENLQSDDVDLIDGEDDNENYENDVLDENKSDNVSDDDKLDEEELAALISEGIGDRLDGGSSDEFWEDIDSDMADIDEESSVDTHENDNEFEVFDEITDEIFDPMLKRKGENVEDIAYKVSGEPIEEAVNDTEEEALDSSSDDSATEEDVKDISDHVAYTAPNEFADVPSDENTHDLPNENVDDDWDYEIAHQQIERVTKDDDIYMPDAGSDGTSDSILDEIIDEVADEVPYDFEDELGVSVNQQQIIPVAYIASKDYDDSDVLDSDNVPDKQPSEPTQEGSNKEDEDSSEQADIEINEEVTDKTVNEETDGACGIYTIETFKKIIKEREVQTEEEGDKVGVDDSDDDSDEEGVNINVPTTHSFSGPARRTRQWLCPDLAPFVLSQVEEPLSNTDQRQALSQHVLDSEHLEINYNNYSFQLQMTSSSRNEVLDINSYRPSFNVNQQPIVLRETSEGLYEDVSGLVHVDSNVTDNALYPELSNQDSLDSDDMTNVMSNLESNWGDINDEHSPSAYEATHPSDSLGNQEVESALVNTNFGYFKNLIFCHDEPANRIEYDGDEGSESVGTCEYLHTVLKYWRDLVPYFPENRQSVMWGHIECHCHNCDPEAPPCFAGWVRIRRELPPPDRNLQSERVFWNVDGSLLRWVLLSDAATPMQASTSRPSCLQIMPSSAPYWSTLWLDEERKALRASIAIEINKNRDENGHLLPPQQDRMVSLLLRLELPVPNLEEDLPSIYPDDDDFDEFE